MIVQKHGHGKVFILYSYTCKFQQYRSRNEVHLIQLHLQSSMQVQLALATTPGTAALDTFATAFHKLQASLSSPDWSTVLYTNESLPFLLF